MHSAYIAQVFSKKQITTAADIKRNHSKNCSKFDAFGSDFLSMLDRSLNSLSLFQFAYYIV